MGEKIIILTQVKGVSFVVPMTTLRTSMIIPVSWNQNSNVFVNKVINKTVFDKLKYMIINLPKDYKECVCSDFRDDVTGDMGVETKYMQGSIDDKTVEFILQIAK